MLALKRLFLSMSLLFITLVVVACGNSSSTSSTSDPPGWWRAYQCGTSFWKIECRQRCQWSAG